MGARERSLTEEISRTYVRRYTAACYAAQQEEV